MLAQSTSDRLGRTLPNPTLAYIRDGQAATLSVDATSKYKVLSELGRGGFAVVSLAVAHTGGSAVALKQPLPVPEADERMRREIDVQKSVAGPHVMPVLDSDTGAPWFTMPVAEGNLLDLWSSGRLGGDGEQVGLEIVEALSEGLADAHQKGIVHRDLSPRNVLAITDANAQSGRRWVVADFGLVRRPLGETSVRLTHTGMGFGTPGFGAPEVWDDAHHTDLRADVYSVGRLLAWLLTGRTPRPYSSLLPTGRLRGLVSDATEMDPDRRPTSLAEVLAQYQSLLTRPPVAPRQAVRDLLATVPVGLDGIRALVRTNLNDEQLLIDDLPLMKRKDVARWVDIAPNEAAQVAVEMARTLQSIDWGRRNFDYANTPLGWIYTVLVSLANQRRYDDAEDVGAAFFSAEEHWDRYSQLNSTTRWLADLRGEAGEAMARAITRADSVDYYTRALKTFSLKSDDLRALVGS